MTRPVESYYDVTDTFAEFFCVDLYYIIIFSNAKIFTLGICPQNFLVILVNLVDYMQLTVLYFWVRLSWILNSISLQSWYKKKWKCRKIISVNVGKFIDNHWIHFACTFDSKAIAYSTQYANEHCIYSRHTF